jgi:short-subunit dehydrogenase
LHPVETWEKVSSPFPPALVALAVAIEPKMTIAETKQEIWMSPPSRVAVITGASSGIGAAMARVLAAKDYKVGLIARRAERLEALKQELGDRAAVAQADVSVRPQINATIHQLADKLGPVDLLIANAGIGHRTKAEPLNVEEVEEVIRVNLLGVIYSLEAVLPGMLERRSGHLAAISSVAAYKGMPGESAYCASKSAVNAFMEGLRIQLRGRGIVVTTVCPGFIKSEMTAPYQFHMPFLLETDDAARRICRALERKTKVFNFPWQTVFLMKLARWLPDRVVARLVPKHPGEEW